jgi:macrolide transport system ATP-binding/permease protein
VVEDTAYTDARWKDHAMYFVPMMQRPASDTGPIEKDEMMYAGAVVLKTRGPMNDMETITRKTLSGINPNLGVLALLLATLGLYGVTAYAVARRTSEIGIRMALGAKRAEVTAMVMRSAIIQAALGLAIGIPAALLCVRLVAAQLYDVKGVDATALLICVATLTLAACFAGFIPARRAASIDPARALRNE